MICTTLLSALYFGVTLESIFAVPTEWSVTMRRPCISFFFAVYTVTTA